MATLWTALVTFPLMNIGWNSKRINLLSSVFKPKALR
jgi:hypothetical protein